MARRAFTDIRGVEITIDADGNKISPDAYKAAINRVEEMESAFLNDPDLEDLADVTTVMTGTSRYRLYSFQLTTTFADGVYAFVYNETVPNAESLTP